MPGRKKNPSAETTIKPFFPAQTDKKAQLVWGIDPGMANLGLSAAFVYPDSSIQIVFMDALRTKKAKAKTKEGVTVAQDTLDRIQDLHTTLRNILSFDQSGVALCCESFSPPQNASVAAKMGMVWGMVASITKTLDLPVFMIAPQTLKKLLTGTIKATKEEIETAVTPHLTEHARLMLSLIPKTIQEHPFDAAASILACVKHPTLAATLKMAFRLHA